jgi:Tol biopolymer transport system component
VSAAASPARTWLRSRQLWLGAAALAMLALGVWAFTQSRREDRIVFVAEGNGTWDLWWMRGDGSGADRLTNTPLDERAPALSPDRSQVAYSTSDGAIWLLQTATRAAARLPLAEEMRHSNPSWSPDGRQLLFTTYTMSGQGEDSALWLYDLAERKPRQLFAQDGAQDFGRIHPDGRLIAYSSSGAVTVFGFGFQVVQQLWTFDLSSGHVEQLLLARGKDTQPAWSPDGRSLVFVSDREGVTQLWRADADGSGVSRLVESPEAASHPAWSPAGDQVVFVATDGPRSRLAVVNTQDRAMQPLELSGANLQNVRDPHWR